jgi:hypothetical protein
MLGVPGVLNTTIAGDTVTITTPELGPDEVPCRYAYVFILPGGEALPE